MSYYFFLQCLHHVFCIDVSSRSLALGLATAAIQSACKAIDAMQSQCKEVIKVGVVSFAANTIQFYSIRPHNPDPLGKLYICIYLFRLDI